MGTLVKPCLAGQVSRPKRTAFLPALTLTGGGFLLPISGGTWNLSKYKDIYSISQKQPRTLLWRLPDNVHRLPQKKFYMGKK
jgi:hypothetical protein